jgi:hypothetical protein
MGRMASHILWKIKAMFETTNQMGFACQITTRRDYGNRFTRWWPPFINCFIDPINYAV